MLFMLGSIPSCACFPLPFIAYCHSMFINDIFFYPKVVELCWNKSSEVLAIWLEDLESEGPDAEKQPKSYSKLLRLSRYPSI